MATSSGRLRDALRHRDLRLLIGAFLVDQIGSWSYLVVLSVYVFDRTHSTQWLAALGICRWGPGLLLASYGGVIADRYQRVTILIVSALASAAVMAAMAVVVATNAAPGLILVLAAASAVALAPYQPAAGALTPEVVGEKDLAAANSLFSALENLVVVLGPAIGGLLLLTGRPVIGVAINAASFVVAAAVISRSRWPSCCSARWTPPSTARPPCCTFRSRSGSVPDPAATATCWPAPRSAGCSAWAWPTGSAAGPGWLPSSWGASA